MKIYLLGVVIFLGLMACEKKQQAKPAVSKKDPISVKTMSVSKGSYQEHGEFLATLEGIEEAELVSYAGGRVARLRVSAGDKVRRGEKLCDIDGEKITLTKEAAVLAEKIAKRNFDRAKIHLSNGAVSELQADQMRMAKLEASQNRAQAVKAWRGAHCVSPLNGKVVEVHVDRFDEVSPGGKTITVARLEKLVVNFGIPESELDGYEVGSPAEVYLPSRPGKSWKGVVSSISQSVSDSTRTFLAEVEIPNKDGYLKLGQTARVKVLRWQLEGQIAIPNESIITLANRRVIVVNKDGVAERRTVNVKASNDKVTIIEGGLEEGDEIVVAGHYNAADGAELKAVDIAH